MSRTSDPTMLFVSICKVTVSTIPTRPTLRFASKLTRLIFPLTSMMTLQLKIHSAVSSSTEVHTLSSTDSSLEVREPSWKELNNTMWWQQWLMTLSTARSKHFCIHMKVSPIRTINCSMDHPIWKRHHCAGGWETWLTWDNLMEMVQTAKITSFMIEDTGALASKRRREINNKLTTVRLVSWQRLP